MWQRVMNFKECWRWLLDTALALSHLPYYHEIRTKYLKQKMEETTKVIEEHKLVWKKTGCTIMSDGRTDKRRTILNFLVNSPKVEQVGEENVVQIVTDNAANYKAAGAMLMEKRKKLYWTPCAAHCIDLMLEDFEKKTTVHRETISRGKDLVRPAVTRFATSYLTLKCLVENKSALIRMFTSNEWTISKTINQSASISGDEEPAMALIYEAMDQAKEKIQVNFNSVQRSYKPLWDIIDDQWDGQMHRLLHAAGYYLNPKLHYSADFKAHYEVKHGLYDCLQKMIGDVKEITLIDAQLESFKKKAVFFGGPIAMAALGTKTAAQWWESYRDEHPELQKFAIRVLSLTCSSSGCERNRSAFEMVHTKRRNRLKQRTMNDVVFVMTNSKLSKKNKTRKVVDCELEFDEIDSNNEWIVEEEGDNEILDFTIGEDLDGEAQNEEHEVA
ncbi:HAT family dimerization domain containing protein, partial [Trifolium pratense]